MEFWKGVGYLRKSKKLVGGRIKCARDFRTFCWFFLEVLSFFFLEVWWCACFLFYFCYRI